MRMGRPCRGGSDTHGLENCGALAAWEAFDSFGLLAPREMCTSMTRGFIYFSLTVFSVSYSYSWFMFVCGFFFIFYFIFIIIIKKTQMSGI
jgi:protein-S-isoprenylcysteine O-methyltransferase Ste14